MKIRVVFFLFFCLFSCYQNYTPKPRAYYKVNLPEKHYERIKVFCSFSFEKPIYTILKQKQQSCFFNLEFPNQKAILHITYLPIRNNLTEHIEESRNLAYKHDLVADAIVESEYINYNDKVYGLLYDYDGSTATSTQFYLTDSVNHFFRGALYFNTEISDSLLPINNFLKADVIHIIESFKWQNQ
tara:strand:+ start:869 stop:1423 length:555 start_codon:yes stop_codon:yes gene_type:complete